MPNPIVCENCGAQYRLPETFKSTHAKCSKCSAKIDVASQRSASAAPKKPSASSSSSARSSRPAAATERGPRSTRSTSRAKTTRATAKTARSASRRGARAEAEAEESEAPTERSRSSRSGGSSRSRSSRGKSSKKSSNTPVLVGSVIGLLAVVAVVLVFVMGDDKPADQGPVAAANGDEVSGPAAADPAAPGTPDPDPATSAGEEPIASPTEATTEPEAGEPAPAAATETGDTPKASAEPKEAPAEESEVFDPKTLDPLPIPEWVSEEEQTQIADYLTTVRDGGLRGSRAKAKLEALGAKSIAPIVNQLRELDYTDSDDSMFAYELNQLLRQMAAGVVNAGFRVQEYGAEIPIKDANFNAKTVKAWRRFNEKYGTPEALADLVKKRSK